MCAPYGAKPISAAAPGGGVRICEESGRRFDGEVAEVPIREDRLAAAVRHVQPTRAVDGDGPYVPEGDPRGFRDRSQVMTGGAQFPNRRWFGNQDVPAGRVDRDSG